MIVPHDIFMSELVKNLQVADNGKSVGMPLIGIGKKKMANHSIGIVKTHRKLAADNLLLLNVFVRRQGRIHHRITQNFHRSRHPGLWHIDPVNGPIE